MPESIMSMQLHVQLAVLQALDRGLPLDRAAVAHIPGADQRDIDRAVELLLESGAMIWAPGTNPGRGPFQITADGKWLLDQAGEIQP
jgi:hypothetical protein